jgi:hypothetical protein
VPTYSALWDGLRPPAPSAITIERSWSNAPALDSETEIELAAEQQSGTALECRITDDLPEAFPSHRPPTSCWRFPDWRGRRELLLARLREQGALTFDLDPAHLTSAVLNKYLRVKERAMMRRSDQGSGVRDRE